MNRGRLLEFFDLNLVKIENCVLCLFVRAYLELVSSVWNAQSKNKKIEGFGLFELRITEYRLRLQIMGCTDLEMKRKKDDLIEICKMANGLEELDLAIKVGRNSTDRSQTYIRSDR